MRTTETEVFVAGGGPAGLGAAIAARAAGFEVTVVDCAIPPIDKACGEGIMPDGLEQLTRLGVNVPSEAGSAFQGIRFVDGRSAVEAKFAQGVGLGIRRTKLNQILIDHAADAGVKMMWGERITGLNERGPILDGRNFSCRWLICADGQNSLLRKLAGLDRGRTIRKRYGFRQHYLVQAEMDYVEVHWNDRAQIYVTPIAPREVCVALITGERSVRLEQAIAEFPGVARLLRHAKPVNRVMGAVTITRQLDRVQRGRIALIGEASGSVDAITGSGLSLGFQEAIALTDAIRAGDLHRYEAEHRRIGKLPHFMASLMLSMDGRPRFRSRVFRAFEAKPDLFERLLHVHTGVATLAQSFGVSGAVSLGWNLLTA